MVALRDRNHKRIPQMPRHLKDLLRGFMTHQMSRKARQAACFKCEGSVVVLAPHPDDEVFGCAGLIARLAERGKNIAIAVMSGGGGSHRNCCNVSDDILIANRRKLTLNACRLLGLDSDRILFLDFKDGAIGEDDTENIDRLKEFVRQVNPDNVFVPHNGEGWADHLATRRIGLALAPEHAQVWEYCVWMWYYRQKSLDWASARSLRMDKEEHARKLAAIREYTDPCAPCGNPWSGVLPPLFVKANSTDTELFFRIR